MRKIRPGLVNSAGDLPPPIHWAIYRDKRGAVEALLNHGADLTLRDRDTTPFDYAVVYARRELIPVLISRGASLDSGMRVALKGAPGGFEEYPELSNRLQYQGIMVVFLNNYWHQKNTTCNGKNRFMTFFSNYGKF